MTVIGEDSGEAFAFGSHTQTPSCSMSGTAPRTDKRLIRDHRPFSSAELKRGRREMKEGRE